MRGDLDLDIQTYTPLERLAIIMESTGCDEQEARRKLAEAQRELDL